MLTSRLLTDEKIAPVPVQASTQSESSRVLLNLLQLVRKANNASPRAGDTLNGVIARPVLRSLLAALQFRSPQIVMHGRRTARLAVAIAGSLGWERPELTGLELSALLHDLGKIGVPDNILDKPGRLSDDEAELLAVHHNIALDVLTACRTRADVIDTITQAFPRYAPTETAPKRASDMPLAARILAVADAYDAMRTPQPYRPALPHSEIMQLLYEGADTRFDSQVVAKLGRLSDQIGANGLSPLALHPADTDLSPLSPAEAQEASSVCGIFAYMYILESLYDGFSLVDGDLRFVLMSRGAGQLLNRKGEELIGSTWTSKSLILYSEAEEGRVLEESELPISRVLAEGRGVSLIAMTDTRLHPRSPVEFQAVPLLGTDGQPQGVAEIYRDQSRAGKRPREYRELKLAASRDPLTGLCNRGELETQLSNVMERFKNQNTTFAMLFLDIDFFKRINDNYGHAVGDEVLVGTSKLLQAECYSGEIIGRFGGEEFVVVCPETDLAGARRRAERLRLAMSQSSLGGDPSLKVTASFGVAAVESGDTVDSVLRRADKALYYAKRTGRNRTCSFTTAELSAAASQPPPTETQDDPFVFLTEMKACITSDLAVMKLRGFLREENATLLDVDPGRVHLQLGRSRLFGRWGKSLAKQPLDIRLEFGDPDRQTSNQSQKYGIRVVMKPVGRASSPEVFRSRAVAALNLMRAYFAAE